MEHDIFKSYPYLSQFMGAYFYQSALEFADSEDAIVSGFLEVESSEWYVTGLWSDIKRFVDLHAENILSDFNEIIKPDYIIGETDQEALDWLNNLAAKCGMRIQL
jgi:CdiI immunity protein